MLTTIDGADLFRRIDGRLARERRRPVATGIDHLAARSTYEQEFTAYFQLDLDFNASWRAHYLKHGPKILDYTPNLPSWW